MQFCDECGSMMRTEGDAWVCASCEHEEPRDGEAEAAMTAEGRRPDDEERRDDGAPAVADATRSASETVEESCPAEGCDGDRATSEMMPKPGGAYEVRLFTCVACGHRWRET